MLKGDMEVAAASLQYSDAGMAACSGLSAGLAVGAVCVFRIADAWPDGVIAAQMAAIACCFFATQDDPAPAIVNFTRYTAVAVVMDAIQLSAILPAIDGLPMRIDAERVVPRELRQIRPILGLQFRFLRHSISFGGHCCTAVPQRWPADRRG